MNSLNKDQPVNIIDTRLKNGQNVLCIIRGLPGSGKSTFAQSIIQYMKLGDIFSTDDYFKDRFGKYIFSPDKLGHAHMWNQKRVKEAMKMNIPLIIIDNTNISIWEMEPYMNMACEFGYHIEIMEPNTWWKHNVKQLYKRNTHGVSLESIRNMADRFQPWEEGDHTLFEPIPGTQHQKKVVGTETLTKSSADRQFSVGVVPKPKIYLPNPGTNLPRSTHSPGSGSEERTRTAPSKWRTTSYPSLGTSLSPPDDFVGGGDHRISIPLHNDMPLESPTSFPKFSEPATRRRGKAKATKTRTVDGTNGFVSGSSHHLPKTENCIFSCHESVESTHKSRLGSGNRARGRIAKPKAAKPNLVSFPTPGNDCPLLIPLPKTSELVTNGLGSLSVINDEPYPDPAIHPPELERHEKISLGFPEMGSLDYEEEGFQRLNSATNQDGADHDDVAHTLAAMFPHVTRSEVFETLLACSHDVDWALDLLLAAHAPSDPTSKSFDSNRPKPVEPEPEYLTRAPDHPLATPEPQVPESKSPAPHSFAHLKLHEIKPFYPQLSLPEIEDIENLQDGDYHVPVPPPLPDNQLVTVPLPRSTRVRLDTEFLVRMQAIHRIPPVPFTRKSLEPFDRSLEIDFSTAQLLYFKWVTAHESEPSFQSTFFETGTAPRSSTDAADSYYDRSETPHTHHHDPDCSCRLNPSFSTRYASHDPNSVSHSGSPLRPKPFVEILQEEEVKEILQEEGMRMRNSFQPFHNSAYSNLQMHQTDAIPWNSCLSGTTPPTGSDSWSGHRDPRNGSLANFIKRKILVRKFPTVEIGLLEELFWGHGFDLEATSSFVDSYLVPHLESATIHEPGDLLNPTSNSSTVSKTTTEPSTPNGNDLFGIVCANGDVAEGYDDQWADDPDGEKDNYYTVEDWYTKKPDAILTFAPKTLRSINRFLVEGPNFKNPEHPNAVSGEDRNAVYQSFRAEAFTNYTLRMECLGKAFEMAKATKKPFRGGIAEYYRETAREYGIKAKAANARAVDAILSVNNYGQPKSVLDLHGLHVAEVIPVIKLYLAWAGSKIRLNGPGAGKFHKLTVITGRGKTKSSQHSRLNYVVKNYFVTKGYPPFEEDNPGTFTLYMVHEKMS